MRTWTFAGWSCLLWAALACGPEVGGTGEVDETTDGGSTHGLDTTRTTSDDVTSGTDHHPEDTADASSSSGGIDERCDCAPDEVCFGHAPGICGDLSVACVPRPAVCGRQASCRDTACIEALCGTGGYCYSTCPDDPAEAVLCAGGLRPPCDPLTQDCPRGEKCIASASTGFSQTHCVSVHPDPVATGEPCVWDPQGFDDCGPAAICWNVDADTGQGTCVPLCEAGASGPSCARGDCVQIDALPICAPSCDREACTTGNECLPHGDANVCVPL